MPSPTGRISQGTLFFLSLPGKLGTRGREQVVFLRVHFERNRQVSHCPTPYRGRDTGHLGENGYT